MTVLITLTTAGTDSGPFDLYSNLDNYTVAFEVNVPKSSLVAGYSSTVVPDYTTVVRAKSKGACVNYTDIVLMNTTTTTTTIATVPCNATASSGGAGITEAAVALSPLGGVIIFEFDAQNIPDKMEFIHNGTKKATSGMTGTNSGPFDNVYGTAPGNVIPTDPQATATPQFIGNNKGVIPSRNSEFLADTGITGIVVESGFQQLLWWQYTDADYVVNPILMVRITGSSGTSWNAKRLCAP